jgi:hypothetical protein
MDVTRASMPKPENMFLKWLEYAARYAQWAYRGSLSESLWAPGVRKLLPLESTKKEVNCSEICSKITTHQVELTYENRH